MKGFKKCPNGHFYKNDLTQCPHCQREEVAFGNDTATVTGGGNDGVTKVFTGLGNDDSGKTVIIGDGKNPSKGISRKANIPTNNPTVFIDTEVREDTEGGSVVVAKGHRPNRRLVGWLVTYSIDPLGIDYKIYEGRNVIGRNIDCNITVDDETMSGEHAIILYRNKEYMIEDSMSSAGTVVNLKDIGVRKVVKLQDGDIIQMGETMFCFKTTGIENT